MKTRCCPNTPQRKVPRDINVEARDAARVLMGTEPYNRSARGRKKIERLFAEAKRNQPSPASGCAASQAPGMSS
jgi:hypothetical protein